MNFKFILTASLLSLSCGLGFAQPASSVNAYIARYKDLAIAEQKRTGVPAAIKLAQGIHESGCGESELSLNARNHFGIKCKTSWTGQTYTYTDDAKNECFRKYDNDKNSYTDHSDFLRNNARYAALFSLEASDYKGWAYGLKKCGYATNPKYAQKIVDLIEKYELNQYSLLEERGGMGDEEGDGDVMLASATPVLMTENKPAPVSVTQSDERTYYIPSVKNGMKGFYARKGDLLLNAAYQNNIRYARLLDLNDLADEPLPADMFIYLEKKNKEGKTDTYELTAGESLLSVAQEQGIRMKELRQYNHLKGTEEPEAGTVLYLKSTAPKKPLLRAPLFGAKANPEFTKGKESDPAYVSGGSKAAVADPGMQETVAVADNATNEITAPAASAEETYNIANEPAVEEQIAQEQAVSNNEDEAATEEAESELDKLKAKLDRSVYGNQNKPNSQTVSKPVSNNNQVVTKPVRTETSYETRPAAQTTTRPPATYSATTTNSGKPLSQDELRKRIEANQRAERETPIVANRSNTVIAKPEPVRVQAPVAAAPAKRKSKTEEQKVAGKKGVEQKAVDKKAADKKTAKAAKTAKPASHTVKKGETVTAIADKYNLTPKEVIKLNKLSANGSVKPGMKLKLK
ncbi:MAG: LysM peptidoglycan-binding domain-containing protein [Sphingobacteriales bacterium]|nr:MAG: LysM peptidoglycan-binding domain-containing protein [Sphingobacteriales bacterium]